MQTEPFPAAEKILCDLETILKKDPKLKLFEVVPVTVNENRSPVLHADHCLGLESWCVPHIYSHSYGHVMALRLSKVRRREDTEKLSRLLMGALIVNPELTTFWNMRKELITSGKLDPNFELHFTAVLLSWKPKCADIFSHRKWILKYFLKGSPPDPGLMLGELEVCEMASDHYSSNYHAWTHRLWTMTNFPGDLEGTRMYEREWLWSENWVAKNISDYSGFHYRQFILSNLIQLSFVEGFVQEGMTSILEKIQDPTGIFLNSSLGSASDIPFSIQILFYEILFCSDLISHFSGHESLWNHRRFIFHSFFHLKKEKISPEKIEWAFYLLSGYEGSFIKKCSDVLNEDMEFATRHKLWLEKILKIQIPYTTFAQTRVN